MKKQALTLTMLALVLVCAAVSTQAQSRHGGINIPFNFTVGKKTLPAGEYTVARLRKDSQNVWLVTNKKGGGSALFTTIPVWTKKTQDETKLVFNNYNGRHFLSQVWIAGDNSGRQVRARSLERQLAKTGIASDEVVVISEYPRD